MTTFDELFGTGSAATAGYLKWSTEGEAYVLKVTGKAGKTHHQEDFATKKPKYFVQKDEFVTDKDGNKVKGPWKVFKEGDFDPEQVYKSNPIMEIEVPVEVVKYKNVKGEEDENFTPFEMNWVPNKDQEEKLKEAMLDSQLSLSVGTLVAVKFLRLDGKERKFKVALKAAE